jgi:hypothetical protein
LTTVVFSVAPWRSPRIWLFPFAVNAQDHHHPLDPGFQRFQHQLILIENVNLIDYVAG